MDSILTSIKKLLGIYESDTSFDVDITMHINTVIMILRQMGIGPSNGFSITGPYETWAEYLPDISLIEPVKTYIALKVRLIFDPPASSAIIEAMNRTISELEWRLNVQVDYAASFKKE
jgi:hypothetical protein